MFNQVYNQQLEEKNARIEEACMGLSKGKRVWITIKRGNPIEVTAIKRGKHWAVPLAKLLKWKSKDFNKWHILDLGVNFTLRIEGEKEK